MEYILAIETGQILPLVLAAIGVVLLLYTTTRRISGKAGLKDSEAANMIPSLRQQQNIKGDLQRLLVDLQDLARQINGHIDTRFCKLEVLIKEADEKIRQLEKLCGVNNQSPSEDNENTPGGISEQENKPERIDPERAMIYKLADAGKSVVEIARQMNKNTGEIELILSLRKSERQAQGKPQIDYRIED